MDDTYLAHYGILGMKWGVRRYQNPDGSLTALGQKRANKKARKQVKKERKEAYKNRALLSDEELNRRINRLQKERQFKELNRSELTPGRSSAFKTLGKYGNQIAGIAIGVVVGKAAKDVYKVAYPKAVKTAKRGAAFVKDFFINE